ncbi:hypothetical protein IE978_22795 [Klebsiella pneumoniae]|uniref:Uncharacterized protein n=1 Tax=Klebsiella pneumoniae TaxID=573 RepID=A0A927E1Q3_KLEPN|nr:hypothetical protein [Klebsiella pneumoniae]
MITSGRVLPRSAWPRARIASAVFLAVSGKAAEVVVEGGMDHRVGVPDASQQRLRGIQRAAMHLGAGRLQGLCGAFAAREADNLMARRLQRRKNT